MSGTDEALAPLLDDLAARRQAKAEAAAAAKAERAAAAAAKAEAEAAKEQARQELTHHWVAQKRAEISLRETTAQLDTAAAAAHAAGLSYAEIGRVLRVSAEAARKRVAAVRPAKDPWPLTVRVPGVERDWPARVITDVSESSGGLFYLLGMVQAPDGTQWAAVYDHDAATDPGTGVKPDRVVVSGFSVVSTTDPVPPGDVPDGLAGAVQQLMRAQAAHAVRRAAGQRQRRATLAANGNRMGVRRRSR